jgi:hypothetical protein
LSATEQWPYIVHGFEAVFSTRRPVSRYSGTVKAAVQAPSIFSTHRFLIDHKGLETYTRLRATATTSRSFHTIASHFSFSFNRYYHLYIYPTPARCGIRTTITETFNCIQSIVCVPAVFRVHVSLLSPLFSLFFFSFPFSSTCPDFPVVNNPHSPSTGDKNSSR